MIPHNSPTFGEEEIQAVAQVVTSGFWAGGPRLKLLEARLEARANVPHAIGVGSGLSALRLALKGLGVRAGDEVLVPAYSCVALANAVLALGAQPVAVDVQSSDWNIDPEAVGTAINERTKALLAVNTFGAPAPLQALRGFGLPVIEDCAHAFGISAVGGVLGSRGDAAICSFYATKLIGAGEGGAVLTANHDVADFVRGWRDYGDQPPDGSRLNDKMTDLAAALALCQLDRLDAMLLARQERAAAYHAHLAGAAEQQGLFRLPSLSDGRVWYRYAIELNGIAAENVVKRMQELDVSCACPVTDWRQHSDHPVADQAFKHLVSLPLYPSLTFDQVEIVCAAFIRVVRELAT